MLRDRSVLPSLLLIVLGSGWTPSMGADPAALTALKQKGLTKSGRAFVIEAEKPVLSKMKEVQAAFAGYAALAERQAAAEQLATHLVQLEERRGELQDGLNNLNQRINEQGMSPPRQGPGGFAQGGLNPGMIAQRDQIKSTLAEVTVAQNDLKSRAGDRKTLDDDVKAKGAALKAALAEVRPMIDEVTKKYADLGADEAVKKSIGELEKATKTDLKLGPSVAFLAGVKAIDQAERRLLGKKATATPKKKGKSKR
jgi:hypothetical protein